MENEQKRNSFHTISPSTRCVARVAAEDAKRMKGLREQHVEPRRGWEEQDWVEGEHLAILGRWTMGEEKHEGYKVKEERKRQGKGCGLGRRELRTCHDVQTITSGSAPPVCASMMEASPLAANDDWSKLLRPCFLLSARSLPSNSSFSRSFLF